jgi:hypothetical protein
LAGYPCGLKYPKPNSYFKNWIELKLGLDNQFIFIKPKPNPIPISKIGSKGGHLWSWIGTTFGCGLASDLN